MDSAGFTEAEMDCLFGLEYGNLEVILQIKYNIRTKQY
jgi:hypothetical protein